MLAGDHRGAMTSQCTNLDELSYSANENETFHGGMGSALAQCIRPCFKGDIWQLSCPGCELPKDTLADLCVT